MEHLLDHHVLAGEEDVCVPIHHWEPCLCAVDELWHLSDQRSSSVMTTKTEESIAEVVIDEQEEMSYPPVR